MTAPDLLGYQKEVSNIIARNEHGREPRAATPAGPADIPQLTDRATIAIESLRSQWRTVSHLGTHERMAVSQLRVYGPMPMSELAARISLSRAAVTSLIDRLEAAGWVQRRPDEHDRRRTVLSLLPRASEEFSSVSEEYHNELVEWAESMSDEEFRTVASFLGRMSDIAERHADDLRSTAAERSLT